MPLHVRPMLAPELHGTIEVSAGLRTTPVSPVMPLSVLVTVLPAGGTIMTPLIVKPLGMVMAVNPLAVVSDVGGAAAVFVVCTDVFWVVPSPTSCTDGVAVAVLAMLG